MPHRALRLIVLAAVLAGPGLAQQGPPPVTVATPLARELVEWQEFTGQFAATSSVEIRSRVTGFLTAVHFQDGADVEKDALLYSIDPRPFQMALDLATADREVAQAALTLSTTQLSRTQSLRKQNVAADAQLEERQAALAKAAAEVKAAEAEIARAGLDLAFAEIRAPVAGRASYNQVSVGNLVETGSTLLTTIVAEAPIWFEFDMSEANYLRYIRAERDGRLASTRDGGVAVQVRLFDEDGFDRNGRLAFVDNEVQRTTGTIRMRAKFDNTDQLLTPGQFGILRMPASEKYTAILLPDEAIVSDQSTKIVYTLNAENIVVPKPVRPGPREFGLRIIREGLGPEDRVIISGLGFVRPGQPVTPVPGEIKPADGRQ